MKKIKKVLITDDVNPLLINGLENLGFKCDYHPKISLDEVHVRIQPYSGIIINSKILVDQSLLDKAEHLEFLGRLGSGMEIVDIPYATQKGVAVFSAPEGNRNAVAEHALGMLLMLMNKLKMGDSEVRKKIWRREANRGIELMGRTVGIWGFGNTGLAFAKKLSGMGVKVLAYDKYKRYYAEGLNYIKEVSPKEIFEAADVVSFHLPLTDETRHLVDSKFIERFKKPFILINTSRGNVVKTDDLIKSLKNGEIIGACLDVFENEKVATFTSEEHKLFDRLYACENTILTPHVAGWTIESKERLASILLDRITDLYK